ncbi:MAG: type 4 pilus major pilin [Alphaproteobacteria bacterium]
MDTSTHTHKKSKRGFTLTEIAIVLGIIGLILGAIWVAASAVYNNLRTSRATTELLQVAQAVRSMYATAATVDAGANMTTIPFTAVAAGPQTTYVQAGVFPTDMVAGAGPYTVTNPWGGSANILSAQSTAANDSFMILFDRVPQSACITMITSNTGSGRDSSLYGVGAGAAAAFAVAAGGTTPGATSMPNFPITASTARTTCATANNNLAFQFRLKG